MYSTAIYNNLDQLPALESEWNEVHRHSVLQSPFNTYNYILMWYEVFVSPSEVRVYQVKNNNITIGFMPLFITLNKGFRELRNLYNDHCFNPQPLVLTGYEQIFPEILFQELLNDKRRWDAIRHGFSYSFSLIPGLFSDDQLKNTHARWIKNLMPTYTILLNKSFDEYFKLDISASLRNKLKRRIKMLADTENHTFIHYQGSHALEHWPLFLELEGSGWKGTEGTSINKTETRMQLYYKNLLLILARTNNLHLYFLKVADKVVAAVFGYTESNVFHYAKIAYDEEYGELMPSNNLLLHIIKDLISNSPEIKRFHLFPWDYGYKHRFVNETTECITTIIYSPTVRGNLFYALVQAKTYATEKMTGIVQQVRKHGNS